LHSNTAFKMDKKLDLKLLFLGVFVHIIIFYSIFDVYFKSPLVQGMDPVEKISFENSPAKRLVLFVADGLRADSFFNLIDNDTSLYLR
jgi:phosphatidylinositol glycan class N